MEETNKVFNINDWLVDEKDLKEEKTIKVSDKLPAFVIRSLTATETKTLEKAAVRKFKRAGKTVEERDPNRFVDKMIELAVVFPPLDNADLQERYGTSGAGFAAPAETLRKMLSAGQYSELLTEINAISGFSDDEVNEEIEEVKN